MPEAEISESDSAETITIERDELNTAIYRGALRAGSILLTKLGAPKVDTTEITYGNGKLLYNNGNRVLLAKGTHREIGQIEGALLKKKSGKWLTAISILCAGFIQPIGRHGSLMILEMLIKGSSHLFQKDLRRRWKECLRPPGLLLMRSN